MDKNQATGLVLIFALIFIYLQFFAPKPQPEELSENTEKTESPSERKEEVIKGTTVVESDSIKEARLKEEYGDFANGVNGENKDIRVETENLVITLSSRGGNLKQVEVKDYLTYDKKPLILINEESSSFNKIINTTTGRVNLGELYFSTNANSATLSPEDSLEVIFELPLANGTIRQKYTIYGSGYEIGYQTDLQEIGNLITADANFEWYNNMLQLEPDLEQTRQKATINYYTADESFDDLSQTSTSLEEETISQPVKWVAFKQKFFTSAIVARQTFSNAVIRTDVNPADSTVVKEAAALLSVPAENLRNGSTDFTFYFGPLKYNILKKVGFDFQKNVYLGYPVINLINRFITVPVFHFLEKYIGNYGLIIVILVFLIRIVLSPLTYNSQKQMAKTKVLQPDIQALKEKYKDDPQKAQMEQMQLFRKVGVNPVSGCIPLLLQMPILLAMFNFFPNSIELRQQSFLWASDLSTYDSIVNLPFNIPFYGSHISLFTVLMTVSTILSQMANNQVSTVQGPMKTMMYVMPVMFMVILNKFPAALSFYYLVSNLVSLGQMAIIRRFVDEKKIKAILEENRKKNANKKKSKFQTRLEEAMKASQQQQQKKAGKR